jgi:cyclin-dependent kinase regulatory subunit CKS1
MAGLDYNRRNKHPRLLTEAERAQLEEFVEAIHYSSR